MAWTGLLDDGGCTMTTLENARDRGAADSYYCRAMIPHIRIKGIDYPVQRDTPEWKAYMEGYDWNEQVGHFKDWGHHG